MTNNAPKFVTVITGQKDTKQCKTYCDPLQKRSTM